MSNASPADILRMHGKWVERGELAEQVSEKLKVSKRQAYRLIKKDKQILRLTLQDRTVLYGLAEFGLPKSQEKPFMLPQEYQEKIEEIVQLNIDGYPTKALDCASRFILTLPKAPQKEKLIPKLDATFKALKYEPKGYDVFDYLRRQQYLRGLVLELLSDISETLAS